MKSKTALTKKDIIVVLICLVLLLLNFGAVGSAGRKRAKRTLCLINLRQLTLAWTQFADDNDGFIVNGAPLGTACQADRGSGDRAGEIPWTGRDWAAGWGYGQQLPEECQQIAIRAGALFPYCQELKLYRCPTGYQGEMRNYSIVDSMNGLRRYGTIKDVNWIKKMTDISNPADRAVFIDEGKISPDSYGVEFNQCLLWDGPPVRHSDGATLSFADGHTEYWKWKGVEMISHGRTSDQSYIGLFSPLTPEGIEDLQRLQIAVWGELGY